MITLTNPAELLSKVLLHHAQLFRGLSLGYMHRALHEVDTEQRARAESMADAYEIVATTLEASAQVEAAPEPKLPDTWCAIHNLPYDPCPVCQEHA